MGNITLGGHNIKELDINYLRKKIGIVSQEPFLFNASIRDNICYGSDNIDTNSIERAAKRSQAWEFIEKLPNGLNTIIGERGQNLSGGQRQRVSLARALSRKGAMLVLDEATSALDMLSEESMKHAISRFRGQRSVLLIAHRLTFITHADLIHVFASGKIIESGTHESLLAQNGAYARMWLTQQAQASADETG